VSTGKSDEAAVKSLGAGSTNALGLYDMSGTVWEWCFTESGSNRINRGANKKIIERKVEFFQQDGPAYWNPRAVKQRGLTGAGRVCYEELRRWWKETAERRGIITGDAAVRQDGKKTRYTTPM